MHSRQRQFLIALEATLNVIIHSGTLLESSDLSFELSNRLSLLLETLSTLFDVPLLIFISLNQIISHE